MPCARHEDTQGCGSMVKTIPNLAPRWWCVVNFMPCPKTTEMGKFKKFEKCVCIQNC